ncbi:hypothetical protein [Streptomyces atratus]|uniref:Peptidase n=1 Tax=Streptomyces atratus TaxID=1893 RepID=A0A1K2APQ5_STRAR|nr:hypothetical protein [Streptomyces atratus]SFX88482.1 hypothetical protein SAMN02787144_1007200 [Streptomyces atratus]
MRPVGPVRPASARRTVRLGIRAAAAAAAAGLLTAGLAAPAFAQEQTDQLWIQAPGEQKLQLGGDASEGSPLDIGLYHDNDNFTVTDGRLSVDISGVAGVADVTWPDNCAPTGTTALCTVPEVPVIGDAYSPQVHLTLRAADGAALGAQGRITYAAVATGGPDGTLEAPHDSFDTTVTVGSGPDLSLGEIAPAKGLQPGDVRTVPFAVTNKGGERSEGLTATFTASYGLDFLTKYAECTYGTLGGDYAPMSQATCSFDQVIEPGDSFTLPAPLRVALAAHAYAERLDISVEPGNGATDLADEDNYTIAAFGAVNTADFAAQGARVTGGVGETVTAELGFRNNGPAWIGNLGSGDPVAAVDFTVPEGATVTNAPADCEPRTLSGGYYPQRTGAPRYSCEMPYWALPDTTRSLPFQLRIDRVVPDAAGRVMLTTGGSSPATFPFDPQPANNTTQLVLNATPAA